MTTVTNPPILDSTGQAIATALANVSIRPQIVDNCTTADSTKALSANQGKQLLDTINGATNYIARGNVSGGNLNDLTSCGTYNCDNCTNSPYTYLKLVVEGDAAGSWIKQTATNILSPYRSCYRIKNVSEPWTSWIGDYEVGTITTQFTHASTPVIWKLNNIVTFFVYITVNATISATTNLALFSVGFRPPNQVFFTGQYLGGTLNSCNSFFRLGSDGVLCQDYSSSLQVASLAVSGTFPVFV